MSLMALGPVIFDLRVNPQSLSRDAETPYAVHEVVGAAPKREFMGEGDIKHEIAGVVFPHHFGGLEGIAALEAARVAHTPVPFMRGTLAPVGWVLIEKLSVEEDEIGPMGMGMEIRFTASLVSVDTPAAGAAGAILSLFR